MKVKKGTQFEIAAIVLAQLEQQLAKTQGKAILGLATGATMKPIYAAIAASLLDFSQCQAFNLDEYCGLNRSDSRSFAHFMNEHLFKFKRFLSTDIPDGTKPLAAEITRYKEALTDCPRDLQLLGIGQNGHIGFNEPGSDKNSTTRQVTLSTVTLTANAHSFVDGQVPRSAITMGISEILASKKIILVATGSAKAAALSVALTQSPTAKNPASFLQLHDDVLVLVDDAAASRLPTSIFD